MANIDPWLASALMLTQLGQGLSAPRRMGQSSLSQFTGALGGATNPLLQLMMLEKKENDPMRQLEMEKMKAEIEAFKNPRPKPMTEYEIKQTEFKTEEQKREAEKTRQALEEKKLGKRKEEIKEYNTAAYFDMENQFPGQPEVIKTGQAATREAAIGAGADPSKFQPEKPTETSLALQVAGGDPTKAWELLGRMKEKGASKSITKVDLGGLADKELVGKGIESLAKLRPEATSAHSGITTMQRALDLIEGGGVTGKGGQFWAWVAPWAEMANMDTKEMQNANEFQLLARAAMGPLRLELVGSGPVSEYEQKLMKELSGGGGTAKQAAKALLTHWQKLARAKVEQYNYTVKGLSMFSPNVVSIFPEFDMGIPTGIEKGQMPATGVKTANDFLKKKGYSK